MKLSFISLITAALAAFSASAIAAPRPGEPVEDLFRRQPSGHPPGRRSPSPDLQDDPQAQHHPQGHNQQPPHRKEHENAAQAHAFAYMANFRAVTSAQAMVKHNARLPIEAHPSDEDWIYTKSERERDLREAEEGFLYHTHGLQPNHNGTGATDGYMLMSCVLGIPNGVRRLPFVALGIMGVSVGLSVGKGVDVGVVRSWMLLDINLRGRMYYFIPL